MVSARLSHLSPEAFGAGSVPTMTNRQEATVIAALRLWQALLDGRIDLVGIGPTLPDFAAIASDLGLHAPLTGDEIDELLAEVFLVSA